MFFFYIYISILREREQRRTGTVLRENDANATKNVKNNIKHYGWAHCCRWEVGKTILREVRLKHILMNLI